MPIFLLLCFDYGTAYTCTNCGKYPSAYVMDGTTIAPLADKIKKLNLKLDPRLESGGKVMIDQGSFHSGRVFLKHKVN